MNALLRYTLCALLLLLGQQSVHAAIGSVSDITGTPSEIARGKQKVAGTKGAEVESNDIVTTKGGVANIVFVDNTKVKVSENSRLLLDDFVYDPKKSDAGKLALKVGLGAVRYASGQIAKTNPQQVAVNTPTATVSVRGTDFSLVVDEAGRSLIVLLPSCRENQRPKQYELEENMCAVGKIAVTTLAGEVVLDRAFQATYVSSSTSRPSKPVVLNTVESSVGTNMIVSVPLELSRVLLASTSRKTVSVSAIGGAKSESDDNTTIEYTGSAAAYTTVDGVRSAPRSAGDTGASTASTVVGTAATNTGATSGGSQVSRTKGGSNDTNIDDNAAAIATANNTNNINVAGDTSLISSSGLAYNSAVFASNTAVDPAILAAENDSQALAYGNALSNSARLAALQQGRQYAAASVAELLFEQYRQQYIQSSQPVSSISLLVTPSQLLELLSLLSTAQSTQSTLLAQSTAYTAGIAGMISGTGGSNTGSTTGANTVSTLSGASYVQSTNMTQISVASVSQLISTCDNITKLCIVIDGQQQYTSTEGVLNNGTTAPNYGSTLVVSRVSETYEHYSQIRMSTSNSNNLITLIQNDYTVSLAVGNAPDANRITINQRWGGR